MNEQKEPLRDRRGPKLGVTPAPKLVELIHYSRYPDDEDFLGYGIGIFVQQYKSKQILTVQDGYYTHLNRPRYVRTVVATYQMLQVTFTVVKKVFHFYFRIKKVKTNENT